MGQGRLLFALVIAVQASAAWASAAAPPLPGLDGDLLGGGAQSASSVAPSNLPDARGAVAEAGPAMQRGFDVVAAVGAALGAVAGSLGGIAAGLVGLGGALLGGVAALLGAILAAAAALGGALAAGLGSVASKVAQHPERLLTPVAGTGVAWGLSALRLPFASLFSRLERHELLSHGARLRMFEYVRERPGAHLSQIHGAMGLGWGATVYHLRRMRDAQLLTARTVGNQLCHFVNGDHHTPEEQQVLAAAKGPKAQAIVDYLKLRGPVPQHEIARELGLSSALVSWHAKRLEDLGVVQRVRTGRECRLALKAPAARVVRVVPAASAGPAASPLPLTA